MTNKINKMQEIGRQRLSARRAWQESEEYQLLCQQNQSEVECLISAGVSFWREIIRNEDNFWIKAVDYSYFVSGNIHRGFFCPSPIADLILGYRNRGREANEREIKRARWRFAYNKNKQMIYVDCLQNNRILNTEYLFWENSVRWGILINQDGILEMVTRECYDQETLIEYAQAILYPDEDGFFCESFRTERYIHDALGLYSCEETIYQPYIQELEKRRYDFEREDGYLKSFIRIDYATMAVDDEIPRVKYCIQVPRKAK